MIRIGNTAAEVRAWLARTHPNLPGPPTVTDREGANGGNARAGEPSSANDKTGRAECTRKSGPKWAGVSQKKSRGRGQQGLDRSGGR